MSDVNVVVLTGRLTRDPENRSVGSNTVSKFGLAVNSERKKNKETGQWESFGYFFDCEVWDNNLAQNFLKKGNSIKVMGSLKVDSWTTKEGQKRNRVLVKVLDLSFLLESSGKKDESKANKDNEISDNSDMEEFVPF